jgi:hypothetical protein
MLAPLSVAPAPAYLGDERERGRQSFSLAGRAVAPILTVVVGGRAVANC